jgi:uncharacterized lipoprotein YddW (UPF0748 family)
MKLRKLATLSLLTLLLCNPPPLEASEFRGLYVDAFHPGFKSHEEVTQMVATAKEGNFNALIVQVRKRGDAYYNSQIEPKALDIEADYDPLADIVTQAHAAGLQVHAWVAVYEVKYESKWASIPAGHVTDEHPDWLTASKDGTESLNNGRVSLDPGVPAVQDHIASVIADIANNYAVDGIHMEGAKYLGMDSGYNSISLSLFQAETNRSDIPPFDDTEWCEWRRSQITKLLRRVKAGLAITRPCCVLSASAMMPSPATASKICFQDWDRWVSEGIVDFVVPMLYVESSTTSKEVTDLLQYRHARHMYIGVGVFQLPKETSLQQIADASTAGANGVALFSYYYLALDTKNANPLRVSDLKALVFAEAAALPDMPWRAEGGQQ